MARATRGRRKAWKPGMASAPDAHLLAMLTTMLTATLQAAGSSRRTIPCTALSTIGCSTLPLSAADQTCSIDTAPAVCSNCSHILYSSLSSRPSWLILSRRRSLFELTLSSTARDSCDTITSINPSLSALNLESIWFTSVTTSVVPLGSSPDAASMCDSAGGSVGSIPVPRQSTIRCRYTSALERRRPLEGRSDSTPTETLRTLWSFSLLLGTRQRVAHPFESHPMHSRLTPMWA
mmetsp:Transcript_18520/g.44639  ORF Transcript_18520/g.44639 Transcript_18520/m.44639 type:complete len:235 (-) Transcript_18520:108-812(-)